ncbi:hypothetical protein [Pseudoalteromonas sp. MEBiC 03485]|uniref:hypothetical protein n=1 Tax=Pseudoalteromonas sp. MEBiC 03485 TaxID=2571103 RepID=UPI00101F8270|nr:hypothetical protein [Pseudoalteromonas sp. MEBiC 03485]RZD21554.1 hypothetical protein EVU92_05605 [Pseudoalteromonas sp. MEBiC 03485]
MKNLKGTLSNTFGGFLTVRGTATFSDIVALSEPKDYQRDTIPEHLRDIEQFYDRGEAVFFPEVILSLELKFDFNDNSAPSLNGSPTNHVLMGEKFKSNVNDILVSPTKSGLATISIPDGLIPFGRIDGNHRLSAQNTSNVLTEEIPFCIVLFNSDIVEKNEKSLFFNINSKGRPLTTEETLKSIIDDEMNFSSSELQNNPSFGWQYYFAREIKKQINFTLLPNLKSSILPNLRSFLVNTINLMLKKEVLPKEESGTGQFLSLLSSVNSLFDNTELAQIKSSGLLSAFIYYQHMSPQKVHLFSNWVVKNHIFELTDMRVDEFIKIFDKIAESKRKEVFISMQFSDDTQQNFEAIKNAIDEINDEFNENIGIREIRIDQFNTGYSYDINDEILSLIETCGLLVADLSKGNKNVYHEIGYLMGLNKGQGLNHDNFILIHNSSVGNASQDVGFNLVSIKQLRVNDTNSLRLKLKEQIKIYYGL